MEGVSTLGRHPFIYPGCQFCQLRNKNNDEQTNLKMLRETEGCDTVSICTLFWEITIIFYYKSLWNQCIGFDLSVSIYQCMGLDLSEDLWLQEWRCHRTLSIFIKGYDLYFIDLYKRKQKLFPSRIGTKRYVDFKTDFDYGYTCLNSHVCQNRQLICSLLFWT